MAGNMPIENGKLTKNKNRNVTDLLKEALAGKSVQEVRTDWRNKNRGS